MHELAARHKFPLDMTLGRIHGGPSVHLLVCIFSFYIVRISKICVAHHSLSETELCYSI
jgi:hypothetical protein